VRSTAHPENEVDGVDPDLFKFRILDLFWLVWCLSLSGFVVSSRRDRVTPEELARMRAALSKEVSSLQTDLDQRRRRVDESIEMIKTRMSDVPTRGDLTRLHELIGEVAQLANELRGTVHSLQNTMQLINQHLLDTRHG